MFKHSPKGFVVINNTVMQNETQPHFDNKSNVSAQTYAKVTKGYMQVEKQEHCYIRD